MSDCIELDGRKYRLFKVKGLFEIDDNEFGNYEALIRYERNEQSVIPNDLMNITEDADGNLLHVLLRKGGVEDIVKNAFIAKQPLFLFVRRVNSCNLTVIEGAMPIASETLAGHIDYAGVLKHV